MLQGRGTPGDVALLKEGLFWATLTVVILLAAVVTALLKGAHLPGLSRLALRAELKSTTTTFEGSGTAAFVSNGNGDISALIGKTADAETVLRPAGKIRLSGATYDAVSEGSYIDAGAKVVVLKVSAGTLVVRAI